MSGTSYSTIWLMSLLLLFLNNSFIEMYFIYLKGYDSVIFKILYRVVKPLPHFNSRPLLLCPEETP